MTLQQKYPYILSQQKENAIPIDICIKQKSMIENPDHLSGFSSFFTLGLIPNIQNINSTWEIQLITGKLTQKKQFDVKMKCSYPIGILEDLLQTHSIPAPIENFDINDRRYNFSLLSFDENAPKFIQLFYDALTKFEREITDRIYARNV